VIRDRLSPGRDDRHRSSILQVPQHLACGGVALVGKAPQLVEVALLASELDRLINRIFLTSSRP